MKKLLTLYSALLLFTFAQAQEGYNIDFKVEGLSDTTVYLGNFFGESTYVKDTAHVNSKGEFSFSGTKKLEEGVYFLVLNKTRLFDIMVSDDQHFSMTTTHPEYVPNMKVTGDAENEVFFKNLLFNSARNEEAQPFVTVLRDSTSTEAAKAAAKENLEKINQKVIAYQEGILKERPKSLMAKVIRANKRIDIPEAPLLPGGKVDSTFSYRYYKAHYWDNFDLSDPAMLRLSEPMYRKKVEDYLDRLLIQHPDTLTKAIFQLADKAKSSKDTYKYLVWTATIKYQNPEIMGLDEVFVNLYDKYFASGEMDYWANEQLKNNLKERADQLRLSLVGKKAPNLIMLDENLRAQSLHDLKNKYTIIYFYDPDCGHCKKETPKLSDFADKTTFDVGIYAVSADTSMAKMKKYINDMNMSKWITVNGPRTYTEHYQKLYDAFTTPTIYVLDNRKTIIAKKIPAERLEDFLTRYEEMEARRKEE
ncbi:Putative thiol-disulfide isomerase [Fulvivirga imtechensis AK7]|uniref:Putative thiol-disulfide isomerase n=1 Tax=Fulvivirga imtechensis AK7 TaxID=1237149 RepID=L8JQK5_9BACT|nr:redoxin domain-containing protein [Fulvivirga imtechensis]ELR69657.1 Putative thiol-disulfide isomerase [Fulvivirga imtechensis AK7]